MADDEPKFIARKLIDQIEVCFCLFVRIDLHATNQVEQQSGTTSAM